MIRPGKITYNPRTGRYHSEFGGFLSAADLKGVIREERSRLESQLLKLTQGYLDGDKPTKEWQRQVIQAIKEANLRSMTIAAGGKAALNKIPHNNFYFQQVRSDLKEIADRLSSITELHQNGERTDGQLLGWMKYRSSSVFKAFSRSEQLARLGTQGANEAWRSVDPSVKHCPDCLAFATKGFIPIEDVIAIGVRCVCGGRCRCNIRYRFNPKIAIAQIGQGNFIEKVLKINEKAA
jgi:hypothetical protein